MREKLHTYKHEGNVFSVEPKQAMTLVTVISIKTLGSAGRMFLACARSSEQRAFLVVPGLDQLKPPQNRESYIRGMRGQGNIENVEGFAHTSRLADGQVQSHINSQFELLSVDPIKVIHRGSTTTMDSDDVSGSGGSGEPRSGC